MEEDTPIEERTTYFNKFNHKYVIILTHIIELFHNANSGYTYWKNYKEIFCGKEQGMLLCFH